MMAKGVHTTAVFLHDNRLKNISTLKISAIVTKYGTIKSQFPLVIVLAIHFKDHLRTLTLKSHSTLSSPSNPSNYVC